METCENSKKEYTRIFDQAWLEDDRFKSWIREVPEDKTKFICTLCKKTLVSGLSHVIRHMESTTHEEMSLNDARGVENQGQHRKRKFCAQWLEDKRFKPWLQQAPNESFSFFCSVCARSFSGGLSQIERHSHTNSHLKNCEKNGICDPENLTEDDPKLLSFEERKKAAEIRFAALIAENNIPFKNADVILNFFKDVGKDPLILESMTLSRKKCANIISNVLSPYETERIAKTLQNTKFSVGIDETSDITNDKWMTFLVRYVHPESLNIQTELLKLIHVDARNCNADELFKAFRNEMWKLEIPFKNIVALSCDNASVMVGKNCSFKTKLAEYTGNNLRIMPCVCHSAALIAQAACAKIPDFVEELLRKVVTFVYSSPKRSAMFKEFQESFQVNDHKIVRMSETRWLSRHLCVERLLESWNSLKPFLQDLVVEEKSKSGEHLLSLMENPETEAYLYFLKYVLNYFNTYNANFQARETKIHLLQPASKSLLECILKNFIKPGLLKHLDLIRNIDISKPDNQKPLEEITFGVQCDDFLNDLLQEGNIDAVNNVRKNCTQFYVTAAEQIRDRLPFDDKFLSSVKVFDAQSALLNNDRDSSFRDVLHVAKQLDGFDEDALSHEWTSLYTDIPSMEKEMYITYSFDDMWKMILSKKNARNENIFPNLSSLVNSIRALPHSNADSERAFSTLTDLKSKKRNKLCATSVNASCVVKSALKARGETAQTMQVNAKHLSRMSSEYLYAKPIIKKKSTLQIHPADLAENCPSSSFSMTE